MLWPILGNTHPVCTQCQPPYVLRRAWKRNGTAKKAFSHHRRHPPRLRPSLALDPAGNAWSRHSLVTVLTLPTDGFQWNKCLCWSTPPPTLYQEMVYSLKASCLKAHTPSDKRAVLTFVSQIVLFLSVSPLTGQKDFIWLPSMPLNISLPLINLVNYNNSLFIIYKNDHQHCCLPRCRLRLAFY